MEEINNTVGNRGRNVVVPAQDPLAIPVIVDNILRRVSFEDMKNARSVSKMWRDNRILPWRNNLAVFNVNRTTMRALKLSWNDNSSSKKKLYAVQEKPFKQYKLTNKRGFHYFPPPSSATEDSLFFWNHCGPVLTYLDIGNVSIFKYKMYFKGLKWIFNCCPNLEELKFCPFKIVRGGSIEDMRWRGIDRRNDIPADAVAEAAAETVVARKLKFLSISPTGLPYEFTGRVDYKDSRELFADDVYLARRFFNLMPNLKGLELDSSIESVKDVLGGLKRLTLGLVPLEKLFLRFDWIKDMRTDKWLLNYIPELGTAQKLKSLGFTTDLNSIWDHPSRLNNILKSIRPRVEEFELKVVAFHQLNDPQEMIRSFDLFRYNFAHLKSLTLKFSYTPLEYSGFPERMRHLSFDFSVLRGTPILEYFFYQCRPINHVPCLTRTLTAADLEGNGGVPNWRLDDNGIERVDGEEAANNIKVEGGNENVFAPEEGETVLKKMKEFHFEGCFGVEAVQALGRIMPSLKSLETILDNVTLPAIFQAWAGNGGTLKNVKVLLLRRSHEITKVITKKKKEFPQIKIGEAVGEENW